MAHMEIPAKHQVFHGTWDGNIYEHIVLSTKGMPTLHKWFSNYNVINLPQEDLEKHLQEKVSIITAAASRHCGTLHRHCASRAQQGAPLSVQRFHSRTQEVRGPVHHLRPTEESGGC